MKKLAKTKREFFGFTARVMMLLAGSLLFLSYLSIIVNPAKAWFINVFGILFIPLAVLNLLLLLWAVRRWSSTFLIPLIALFPSAIFIGRYLQFSSSAEEGGANRLKVISYNVGRFSLGKAEGNGDQKDYLDSVIHFINDSQADVVCLQEVCLEGVYDAEAFFKEYFPAYNASYFMYVNSAGSYGNLTLSRYPVLDKGLFDFEHSSNLALYSDIQIGDLKLRIYNCHFESYSISLANFARSLGKNEKFRETEDRVRTSMIRRPQQVDLIASDIENCPVEAIVAGDFNDTPMSYTYRRLLKNRKDSFVEAGKGFGATYSVLWPLIRIDYVLYPDHFSAVSHQVPRLGYSDHYPVIAEINL